MKKLLTLVLATLLCVSALMLFGCEAPAEQPDAQEQSTTNISISQQTAEAEAKTEPETSADTEAETLGSMPFWDPDKVTSETLTEEDYIYGTITAKYEGNVLLLKPYTPYQSEQWGDTVYIRTDKASEWCVGDRIEVFFTQIEHLKEANEPIMIIADEVHPLVMYDKPVIYLYPETPTEVSVNLTLNGRLTCTYPDYEKGWDHFTAHPDGTLVFPDGKEYYCLYWEGIQDTDWDFSTGFCVKGEDTAEFLEWALAAQGLTPREANEFIIYWLPLMQENPYNVISFQSTTYTDSAVLEITPTPDSLIRVFMAWYATDTAVEMEPQVFETPARDGFTVVEWGGSEVKVP